MLAAVTKTLLALFILAMSIAFVGSASPVSASSNTALKWTTQTPAGNGGWTSVTWSPELGKFVAVANQSTFPFATVARVMSSADAKTWTLVSSNNMPSPVGTTAGVFTSVVWSPEQALFVAVVCNRTNSSTCGTSGTTARVLTSPDGDVWTERTTPDTDSTWQSITWSAELDLFVAVADGGTNRIMTSPDGITWTARTAPEANAWRSVTWSPDLNLFVAVSDSGTNRVMASSNGTNWTAHAAAEANNWQEVTWSPDLNKFVAVASDGTNRVMTSSNGIAWTPHAAAAANAWASVSWSPQLGRFVAVANGGTSRAMTSTDGENWTTASPATDSNWNSIVWSPERQAFTAVASGGTNTDRVMTGAMITASTNAATNVAARSATLNGDYQDDFAGANVFFRYRVAGSSDPFTETAPQAVTTEGAFNANISSLNPNTTYEFKAVVQWSSASGTQTLEGGLETFATMHADDDNDSIFNDIEDAAPNSGDGNNDGTSDSTQPHVASFVNPITNKYAVLEVDSSCQIDPVGITAESANASQDKSYEYPAGLLNFTANCGAPGFTTPAIHYHYGVEGDYLLRKYNPNDQSYFAIDGATTEQQTIAGQTAIKAMFQITDGSKLDMDGATDGVITDPVGLARQASATPFAPGGDLAGTGQNSQLYGLIALGVITISLGIAILKSRAAIS